MAQELAGVFTCVDEGICFSFLIQLGAEGLGLMEARDLLASSRLALGVPWVSPELLHHCGGSCGFDLKNVISQGSEPCFLPGPRCFFLALFSLAAAGSLL